LQTAGALIWADLYVRYVRAYAFLLRLPRAVLVAEANQRTHNDEIVIRTEQKAQREGSASSKADNRATSKHGKEK
jgi:cytoskeletal protein RodZ